MDYIIKKDKLFEWCQLNKDEILNRDNLKCKLTCKKDRKIIMEYIGNMMADEVIQNNKIGKSTKWILPAGPMDEYDTFIDRVNKERISLKNLYIFHMDEFLNWECRPYPVGDTYESLTGTMLAGFYGRIENDLNVPIENRFWPRINDMDYVDNKCKELGGIDTLWAGVGAKGLIGFCEAPRSYWHKISLEEYANSKTRIIEINPDTVVALSQRTFGTCYDRIPPKSITLGFKTMLSAKKAVLMIATGDWKQTAVRVALFSEPTLEYPVTLVTNFVDNVELCCDEKTLDHPMSYDIKGW